MYTNHEDAIESTSDFSTKELAEEQVNYELHAASLRIAEG
jgi:hypothetical protein